MSKLQIPERDKRKLKKEERQDELETAVELIELRKARRECFVKMAQFTDLKRSARKAKSHLENAMHHEPRFIKLSTVIQTDLEREGADPGMIHSAGRLIGTARFIGNHIQHYISLLDTIINLEEIPQRFKFRNTAASSQADHNMMWIYGQLGTDIDYLMTALRHEKRLESQT